MENKNENTEPGEQYTEYVDANGRMALIHDPTNADAWIQSNHTVAIEA